MFSDRVTYFKTELALTFSTRWPKFLNEFLFCVGRVVLIELKAFILSVFTRQLLSDTFISLFMWLLEKLSLPSASEEAMDW